ncbi:YXWGXW repeat-containing protein [Herbaspirillum sp. SJZ130]|nr:YXWGXW repeat-containing protein [Herbaspirillum sp. SJZ130]TQK08620.1 YXWGXW repeat-containing protein [Herbaspirillum sp. SJZ106]TWC71890.1 YXWGXW repeat-containing protein [Herbaspirillum sp. SJZ099]
MLLSGHNAQGMRRIAYVSFLLVVITTSLIMRKIIFASLIAIASAASVLPAVAQAQVSVSINIGPPPLRVEPLPPPRHGYIWAPGYWDWNGHDHVWREGRWMRERSGYSYAQPVWRQGPNGWVLDRGGWRGNPHRHDDGERRPGRGNDRDHCPPGHAKKGEC